jgi:hypothetical protein
MFDAYVRKSVGLHFFREGRRVMAMVVVALMVFQVQAVFFIRATTGNELVGLADMVSPLLAYSHVQGAVDEQRNVALSIGLRPQNQLRLHSYYTGYFTDKFC